MDRDKLQAGDIVDGSWKVIRKIGSGGYGQVYEIRREEFGQTYEAALKVMSIPSNESELAQIMNEHLTDEGATIYIRSVVENISNEMSLMYKLSGTGNIVNYQDHKVVPHKDDIGWDVFIRMELLTPINERIKQDGGTTEREIAKLGIDICKALELCEKNNIVHRDIKPENLFITKNGDYKLGDFGIARTMDNAAGMTQGRGTEAFMAPEVFFGMKYDHTADIYSLGMVLYYFLNRNRGPFLPPAPNNYNVNDKTQAHSKRMQGEKIPEPINGKHSLKSVILKACEFSSDNRYKTASEMRNALERIYSELSNDFFSFTARDNPPTPSLFLIKTRFFNEKNEQLSYREYKKGEEIIPPPISKQINGIDGKTYIFTGWSPSLSKLAEEDTDYYAQYSEQPTIQPAPSPKPISEPEKKQKKKWLLPLILGIFATAIAVIAGLYFLKNEPEPPVFPKVYESGDYRFVIDELTWEDAFKTAKMESGFSLITLDTPEKYKDVTERLDELELTDVIFFIGGLRQGSAEDYYWINSGKEIYGNVLNSETSWCYTIWEENEPSFNSDSFLALAKRNGEWVLIDVSNNYYSTSNELKCGYIAAPYKPPEPPYTQSDYEFVISDCTWTEAQNEAIAKGGYLAAINSIEEYNDLIAKIEEAGYSDVAFRIGGKRTGNSRDYYWVAAEGAEYGEPLNSDTSWLKDIWAENEPSFEDGDTVERYLEIYKDTGSDKWVINDVPDKLSWPMESNKCGFIIEKDSSVVIYPPVEPLPLEWSDWSATLPAGVTSDNYAIESRLVYRSTDIVKVEDGTTPGENYKKIEDRSTASEWVTASSWTTVWREDTETQRLKDRRGGYQTSSGWSVWSTTRPKNESNRTIVTATWDYESNSFKYTSEPGDAEGYKAVTGRWSNTPTQYSYKDIYYTDSEYLYETRTVTDYYYNNAGWSDWSDKPIKSSETVYVQNKIEYRYAASESGRVNPSPSMSNFNIAKKNYSGVFVDVEPAQWYSPESSGIISTVVDFGMLLPSADMKFFPEGESTIGQVIRAAVMINRVYNGDSALLGVNDGTYTKYVEYAKAIGMINDGEFSDLNRSATRREMAQLFCRALPEEELAKIKDIETLVDTDSTNAIKLMEAGVLSYPSDKKFNPENSISRVEIASMVDKLIYPEHRK